MSNDIETPAMTHTANAVGSIVSATSHVYPQRDTQLKVYHDRD